MTKISAVFRSPFWRRLFAIWLTSRILVFGAFFASDAIAGNRYQTFESRAYAWAHYWDSGFYIRIATEGYALADYDIASGGTLFAFFPLMPLSARAMDQLTGLGPSIAGAIANNIYFVAALALFALYCRRRADDATTLRAGALLAFCPHGFAFSVFYSESLYLLLAVAAVVAFDRNRFAWSSATAALASLTRPNGVFLVFFFAGNILQRAWSELRSGVPARSLIEPVSKQLMPLMFAPLGLVAFWWYCYGETGDAFAQSSSALHGWSVSLGAPFRVLGTHFGVDAKSTFWLCSGLFFLASSGLLLRYRLIPDFAFVFSNILLFFSNPLPSSMLRYCIVLFPIYLGLAMAARSRPWVFRALLAAFVGLNLFLCYAWIRRYHISI